MRPRELEHGAAMRLQPTARALAVTSALWPALWVAPWAALSSCTAVQDESRDGETVRVPTLAAAADPMANFARLVSGEWWVTLADETSSFNTWHWGPGKHSVRSAHAVDVYYWHPARQVVRSFSMHPFARSVGEGTIRFEGETAEDILDLWQTSGPRKLASRWVFDGPDEYQETLLELMGPDGFQPLTSWKRVRKPTHTEPSARAAAEGPKPPHHMHVFAPLLGQTWEAQGVWSSGETFHVRTDFEWIASVDALYARSVALIEGAEPVHVLDAYLFHHTGTNTLRCLALTEPGGVYAGDWTVLDGGALEFDLEGYVADRVVPRVVRFDFEADGRLRQRIWSRAGVERTLVLDAHHAPRAQQRD